MNPTGWTIDLPLPPGPPCLGVGAQGEWALCWADAEQARLSPSVGSMPEADAARQMREWARDGLDHLHTHLRPAQGIGHDLHPDFLSTHLADEWARAQGLPTVPVQHHHAHLAAVWAEHAAHEGTPHLVGLALDGFGLGTDGQAWGGELLHVQGPHVHRLGHLSPLPLPGGDAATREPWRLAAAVLHRLGQPAAAARLVQSHAPPETARAMTDWLARRGGHQTSSLGRLFDAAAALLGVCMQQSHPAQAAQRLEALATQHGMAAPLAGGSTRQRPQGQPQQLDFSPLLAHLASGVAASEGAAVFHATVAQDLADWLIDAARAAGTPTVALGGGCLHNRSLRAAMTRHLDRAGLRSLWPQCLPPGDRSIAYGQVVVTRLILAYH